ncbi:uncharacterized protein BCR38DRAFT_413520 [Pseudomassariella vexata]|uniref:Uncharacterized protein n=1 Tax=Pseudomassariella vexata TaxID=1141098 RepID=A0A1Y2DFR1_9PEZI|nr:uncharacterized protein BCR38DRAFT_413520 [Pseudomassariella vexata]ORY58111.1 hypothetical protein BCR38DRAFT_413520 [Pseudomassariella vexata]
MANDLESSEEWANVETEDDQQVVQDDAGNWSKSNETLLEENLRILVSRGGGAEQAIRRTPTALGLKRRDGGGDGNTYRFLKKLAVPRLLTATRPTLTQEIIYNHGGNMTVDNRKTHVSHHTMVKVVSSPLSYQSLDKFMILPTLSMHPATSVETPNIRPT